ncbi:hypothetical protein [Pyramidobacter piscolens]|uniref:hypothetical protein n=1 Tax=Pyramidobacter piscolens TaxID=638849 RepID=UPI003AF68DDB
MNTQTLSQKIWKLLMAYGMVPVTGTAYLLGATPREIERTVLAMRQAIGSARIDLYDGFIIWQGRRAS